MRTCYQHKTGHRRGIDAEQDTGRQWHVAFQRAPCRKYGVKSSSRRQDNVPCSWLLFLASSRRLSERAPISSALLTCRLAFHATVRHPVSSRAAPSGLFTRSSHTRTLHFNILSTAPMSMMPDRGHLLQQAHRVRTLNSARKVLYPSNVVLQPRSAKLVPDCAGNSGRGQDLAALRAGTIVVVSLFLLVPIPVHHLDGSTAGAQAQTCSRERVRTVTPSHEKQAAKQRNAQAVSYARPVVALMPGAEEPRGAAGRKAAAEPAMARRTTRRYIVQGCLVEAGTEASRSVLRLLFSPYISARIKIAGAEAKLLINLVFIMFNLTFFGSRFSKIGFSAKVTNSFLAPALLMFKTALNCT
jgi:hypothetical protein